MTEKLKEKLNNESGAVMIVEAAFVFPVMFIILLFLIYMGNAYYIKAQIEGVVEKNAVLGANYCTDPLLETIKEDGGLPNLTDLEIKPYRYLFGGMGDIEKKIGNAVQEEISGKTSTFFSSMKPKLVGSASNIAQFNNYVVYSTFSVEVKYKITFPIRYLGDDTPVIMEITSRAEVPVDDASEFIRNTDMVIDMFHGTELGNRISDVFSKINDFLSSFAGK